MRTVLILATTILSLAGCKPEEIDQAQALLTGNATALTSSEIASYQALIDAASSAAAVSSSVQPPAPLPPASSSQPIVVVAEPSSSAPLGPCVPIFRLLSCSDSGEYVWL